jgi:hypothetical protein
MSTEAGAVSAGSQCSYPFQFVCLLTIYHLKQRAPP